MHSITPSRLALIGAMALLALATPAQAHGVVGSGLTAGFLHPLTGLDHLVMLMAVATAAVNLGTALLAWAFGGALMGALLGGFGVSVPAAELLAAVAIPAVALILLRARRPGDQPQSPVAAMAAPVVALGVAVHALLHGLEVPSQGVALLWWLGALTGSTLTCGLTMLALRRLPALRAVAPSALLLVGGCLTVAALLVPAHGLVG
mgnify:FL=1